MMVRQLNIWMERRPITRIERQRTDRMERKPTNMMVRRVRLGSYPIGSRGSPPRE